MSFGIEDPAPRGVCLAPKPLILPDERIEHSVRFILTHYQRPLSLTEIAAYVGLSASRFEHLFREQTGTSPMQLLRLLRMREAEVLLSRTRLSIKEVVARVGLGDCSHFAKDFRRIHGVSPLRYRRYARPADALARVLPWDDSRSAGAANSQPNPPTK